MKIPDTWKQAHIHVENFIKDITRRTGITEIRYAIEYRKLAYGWIPDKTDSSKTAHFSLLRLRFPSESTMRRASYMIQKNGHTVYEREYKFSTVHKFCDDLTLQCCDRFKLNRLLIVFHEIRLDMRILKLMWMIINESRFEKTYRLHTSSNSLV